MYTATERAQPLRGRSSSLSETDGITIGPRPPAGSRQNVTVTVGQVAGWLRRGWAVIALAALVGTGAGFALTQLATPRFTAFTDLVIGPSNLRVVANDLYTTNLQSDSQILDVESKMRVFASSNVLRRVIARLGPADVEEFAGKPPLVDLRALLGLAPDKVLGTRATALATELAERIKVSRQERSYVVTASVWTSDPELSARVANALAEAFKEEISHSDSERAGLAAQSLTNRLSALKTAVSEAEARVEVYRRENALQQGAGGQLVNAQAMDRMNSKLTDVRGRLAEAEAHYREVERALRGSGPEGGSMTSQTLTALRGEEAGLRRQIASLSQTFGPRHPSLVNTRVELDANTRLIQAEIQRLRRGARMEVEQAKLALQTLTGETLLLRGTVSEDDRVQVKLRELERDASAKAALYQAFLARAGEAAERQQVDATDVRVISEALPPKLRTWPPRPIVALPGGAALGLLLGALLVAAWGYLGAARAAGRIGTA